MSGPRDWSPPEWAPTGSHARTPRRRRVGGFARGVLTSLLVVPLGIAAWVLLWQFGLVSSIVGWGVAVLALHLFRWGSGGVISDRGVRVLVIVVTSTIVLGLTTAFLVDAARAFTDPTTLRSLAHAALDPGFWDWVASGLASGRWGSALWISVFTGLALAIAGLVPPLVSATRGRVRGLGLAVSVASVVVVIGASFAIHAGFGTAQTQTQTQTQTETGSRIPVQAQPSAEAVAASSLVSGSCLNQDATQLAVSVPCETPHYAEVYYAGPWAGVDPSSGDSGEKWLRPEDSQHCDDAFAAYVGVPADQSRLGQWYFEFEDVPAASGGLVCAVYDPASAIQTTLKNAAR